ncbi:Rho GTPase activation protein [Rhizopus microsporus]|uniref:Rho GTPase activation protein n=1 Tax=Rhizopus microsporus TaxID=58291 RepID=A0A1X0S0B7_RHIZD|nr:Rho GTPase activation protein [Rhizopus microsporus]
MSIEYEWVEVSNPNFPCSFYANHITGECSWSRPLNESSILPKNPDGDWWELWDEKHNLPYYYHTRANVSNWMRPTDTNIISLVKIRPSEEFSKQMSLLVKKPSISGHHNNNTNTMKRNSRSLDLSEITMETDTVTTITTTTTATTRRQHQRSTSDSMAKDIIEQVPNNGRKQSICSTKEPMFPKRPHLPSLTKKAANHPFKNLAIRAGSPTSRYSIAISSPTNNPEAAIAMHPLNQPHCSPPITPAATLKKPTLPAGLQQEINKFAIDGFAKKYFATHKKGLFRRKVPMNEMLKWTKDSLRQPLIMMNKELYKDALKCFKLVQTIMGDRSRSRHSNEIEDIQTILTCGITKGQMRDEIYVQICKQLHENPNPVTFPPSKNLEAYLTDFVQHHHHSQDPQVATMSQHVSNKLKRICKRGAKGKVLTSAEIARAKEAPFKPSVFGESLQFIMDLQANTSPDLKIPMIVPFLTNAVRETNGQLSEGIFRVPGDADAVTDLRVRIENGNYDATGITDPNVPASLLKYWLRDLVEPIITSENYYDCIKYAEEPEMAINIINRLPDTNRRIALYIINFLQEFTDPEIIKHTLMNVSNLAMVFAPNFLRCPSESLTTVFENSKYEQAFLRTLINETHVDPSACAYESDSSKVFGQYKDQ